ncbi:MAG: hypothetical protein ACXW2A_13405, partial [Burkholderiales bacterium]
MNVLEAPISIPIPITRGFGCFAVHRCAWYSRGSPAASPFSHYKRLALSTAAISPSAHQHADLMRALVSSARWSIAL